jgi:hypothetical protein
MLTAEERAAATALHTAHHKRLDAIRRDGRLSPAGRQRALAQQVLTTRGALRQLRADSDTRGVQRRRELETALFGPRGALTGMDTLSARDAADRADACKTPAEALRLLRRAELAGDTILARALFSRAWGGYSDAEPGWADISRTYLEHRPEENTAAAELAAILSPTPAHRLSDRLHTDLPQPPDLIGSPETIISPTQQSTTTGA